MANPDQAAPPAPTFWQAFRYWLRLGFISFGGPAGQIAVMHEDLVVKKRWISEKRFLHALNYCMVLPGPEAQQLTIYIGWLLHRTAGGLAAGTLFILPSFVLMVGLTWAYLSFGTIGWVQGLFWGIKPAVVAIVLFALYRIGSRALTHPVLWVISATAFALLFFNLVGFPWIVLGAGLAGLALGRFTPQVVGGTPKHGAGKKVDGPAVLGDETPVPEHARFRPLSLVRNLVVGASSLAGVFLILHLAGSPVLQDMAAFFTKAAFITFGGAYAVLPYVMQGGVHEFHWLTTAQMMDGLALGETTPGPLIMIVTFVGYVGGWTRDVTGSPWMALAGASVATFCTFLPSFVFILAGAPLVEKTRGDLRVAAPLTAITAAVVGVILTLGLMLAHHGFWTDATAGHPFGGRPDVPAMGLCALALLALWRFKWGTPWVVLVCAGIGVGFRLLWVAH